jgi:hypothetical protein
MYCGSHVSGSLDTSSLKDAVVPGTIGTGASSMAVRGSSAESVDMPSKSGTSVAGIDARDAKADDEAEKEALTADKNDEERALDDERVDDDQDEEGKEDEDENAEGCAAEDAKVETGSDWATRLPPDADGRCFLRWLALFFLHIEAA